MPTKFDPVKFEQYAFLWSQIRLIIAAIALFLGGIPPLFLFFRGAYGLYGLLTAILTVCWIISGIASVYLLYRWHKHHEKNLFGGKKPLDTAAFFVMTVSGINLGVAGIIRTNIGMSIWSGHFIFIVVGLIYLATVFYLHGLWNKHGRKVW